MGTRHTVKSPEPPRWQPTRRELLAAAAVGSLSLLSPRSAASGQAAKEPVWRLAPLPPDDVPWWLRLPEPQARVVDIRSGNALHASTVDRGVLSELLDQGIRTLTGAASVDAAWRSVLGPAERIVLKFNAVGAEVINTNAEVARLLVRRLAGAGYRPEKLALVEAPAHLAEELGTRGVVQAWGPPVRVGDDLEPLVQYLYDADAMINVPLLKTHQIAGMSGCMKNLSHALIRHPARYHANGCSPYIAQVVSSKEVSSKLRLNVVSALRVVVSHGPDAREEDIAGYGGLLLGFDPLAVDSVGLAILATERRRRGLVTSSTVPQLASAAQMGIGRWRPAEIERVTLEIDR